MATKTASTTAPKPTTASNSNGHRGIRSVGGLQGTLLGSFRPLGSAVGLMSALATSGTMAHAAQDPAPAPTAPAAEPAPAQSEAKASEAAVAPATAPLPAPGQLIKASATVAPAAVPPPLAVAAPDASASAKASSEPLVLPTVQVQGKADSYKTEQAQMNRVATPLVNTPQAVAIVPKQVMEEQRATTVRDALRNVSGITVSAGEGGRQGDTFILRGFSGQSDVFRDGARDLGWYTRDTFNLEGVEVFFGPSSVLFGRGSTGGAVNLVTKAPKKGTFAEIRATGASAPQGRLEADVNHAFNDKIQMRVNAMGQMGGIAGRNSVEANRGGFAPSFRFALGEKTVLGVDYFYQRERSTPDYGVPFVGGKPVTSSLGVARETFYGVEGDDKEEVDAHIGTARLEHDFGAGFRLSNSLRVGRVDRLSRPTAVGGLAPAAAPTTVDRSRFETETDNVNVINQTDLRLEFATGILKHAGNLGVELAREKRRQTRHNFQVTGANGSQVAITGDLRNPNPTPDLGAVNRNYASFNRGTQLGGAVYASDQVAIGQYVEVLGSLRVDSFDTEYRTINAQGTVANFEKKDTLFNYRGGLVLHPVPKTSVYAMVGSSSNPSAEAGSLSDGTASLDPEKNTVYELGAKADLLEDRLGVGGSVFRIEKNNARIPGLDPASPLQILEGKQRVQGANIGGAGTLMEGWKLYGSYTFLRSRIRRHSTDYLLGQELPNTPPHSLSLWTTLDLPMNISVGGGAGFQSETVVNNPATASQVLNKVPSYWRMDAFASYAPVASTEFQLNVSNLTNALYYQQLSGSRAVPGEGRVVLLTALVRL